jgi:hypothetical protein
MFFSCPHCRDLVATDRDTNLPPVMCPRCGGRLRADAPRQRAATGEARGESGPSFASFLQDAGVAPTTAGTGAQVAQETSEDKPGAAVEADTTEADAVEVVLEDETLASAVQYEPPAVKSEETETTAIATTAIEPQAPAPVAPSPAMQPLGPSFTRQRAQPSIPARTARWQWAALLVLTVLLAAQVLVADRARLAADANWRPVLSSLCGVLGCSLPAWHQPGAFVMLSRDVSPIPETRGGLNVQATFRNDAHWPQAWPVLLLSLSDADGRVLGSRAFTPKEYLGAAATQTELAPGQSAQIALKLYEPNPDAVAFSFDFR